MLDNSQFRKNEDSMFWNNFSYIWIGLCFGIIIGAIILFICFHLNILNSLQNNGLMYEKDCKTFVPIVQPAIKCTNYTIVGEYYYCNIDDVKVLP